LKDQKIFFDISTPENETTALSQNSSTNYPQTRRYIPALTFMQFIRIFYGIKQKHFW